MAWPLRPLPQSFNPTTAALHCTVYSTACPDRQKSPRVPIFFPAATFSPTPWGAQPRHSWRCQGLRFCLRLALLLICRAPACFAVVWLGDDGSCYDQLPRFRGRGGRGGAASARSRCQGESSARELQWQGCWWRVWRLLANCAREERIRGRARGLRGMCFCFLGFLLVHFDAFVSSRFGSRIRELVIDCRQHYIFFD